MTAPLNNKADHPGTIPLFQHESGSTFSTADLKIAPDGSLQLSSYDIGPLCQEAYYHDDCEYDVTIAPKHKDTLLLALLRAKFAGDSQASGHFRGFLDTEGIPYDFHTWP